jgi:amino acid adenylation domain-containing protein
MNSNEPQESVAIIGMAGRFPQANNLDEFWRNLRDGRECVSFFNDEQVQWLPIEHPPRLDDPRYVKARAVMEKPEWFDAAFFGMNPKEAEVMDPQHRVFLECAWEALEHAGCNPDTFDGMIGVFAGASMNTYLFTNLLTNPNLVKDFGLFSSMIMNDGDFVPTRVSYKFNLRGPSINVQTACSTSLVAVCMAAQNLLSYRCDVALAGGVSITFPPNRGQHHQEGGILSPDGHCRTFDAKAAGTVLGDGAGVVVLKRLSEAIADGDNVLAVIKGTAINNDGSVKIGYTAPSADGQAEVIALAQAEAGIAPETISYVEAHGTGTPLGDPIEIAGLTKAFGVKDKKQFCAVGSVKSNIGHLDIAAGVAGLIKTVLALQHEAIPPSLHFESPNPKIDFANSPFVVNHALRSWPRNPKAPRRAGVSSFGIGGTNAHAVLEEAPVVEPSSGSRKKQLLLLSAKTATALDAATENLARHLESHEGLNGAAERALADVAYTLQVGRKVFAHRRAVVVENAADAVRVLRAKDAKRIVGGKSDAAGARVAFLFPGQGAQAVDMARELYDAEPVFRDSVDRCCDFLRPKLGLDLRDVIYPGARPQPGQAPLTSEAASKLLTETRITQPALFVIEYALAQMWIGWGIKPAAMIGHSLGEYVAAAVAGVMSLEDALTLVAERARLMQAQPEGAMLAIRLPEEQVKPLLNQTLALAAVNAPGLCVVSGPFDAVSALERQLAASAIPSKRLATSHAFHSAMMEPALRPLAEFMRRIKLHAPKLPWVSNLTGTWITPEQATSADYWTKHLRQTVRFADGVAELVAAGNTVLLEVGPGSTLAGLARQHPSTANGAATVVATLGRTRDGASDLQATLTALGELWVAGVVPNWRDGFYRDETRRIVPLPTYPFERKRYWIEPAPGTISALPGGRMPELTTGPRLSSPELRTTPLASISTATTADATGSGPNNVATDKSTLATLREIFTELSGIDLKSASADDTFYELGFDSLFLTQASRAVGNRFGVEVTFRQLREDLVTLAKLAAHLEAKTAKPTAHESTPANSSGVAVPETEKRLPLTDAQREMWYASQMGTSVSSAYNEESTLRLDGALDVTALHRALNRLAARHEALRTTFSAAGDEQIIAPTLLVDLPVHDFSSAPAASRDTRARECADDEVERPFDLASGPLFRATLLRLAPDRHMLVLVVHHIICDGWSLGTLVRELGELYGAETQGRASRLAEATRFSVYAHEESQRRNSAEFTRAEEFWKAQFADTVPVLELPTDRPRPAQRSYAGGFVLHRLPSELTAAVKRLCAERDCTMFTTLLGAFNVLLHRLSGQEDLVVGVPSASQVMSGHGNLVGHFANLLAVRSRIADTESFAGYLMRLREQMTTVLGHWQYPFGNLVQHLKLARDASRMPLANVVFNSSALRGQPRFGEITAEPIVSPKRYVNFDLNFNFATADDTISLGCYYSSELFEEETVRRWIGHFETLLREATQHPQTPVVKLPLLANGEREVLVRQWNATAASYPDRRCVHDVVFERAQQKPNATALVHGREQLSYGELAMRAAALATRLRALGVKPDVPVGICLERSFDMVVAVVAVLRAGGAYVPLDPTYPADRLSFMLADSGAPVLLTQRKLLGLIDSKQVAVVCVDAPADAALTAVSSSPAGDAATPGPDNLAYLIYTSGSTGKPKGVAMPHKALSNLLAWQVNTSLVAESGRTLQFSSLSFDVSFQEMFSTFAAGGTLVLIDDALRRDARELWRVLIEQGVHRLFLPFVALQQLAESFRSSDGEQAALREVITAGEPLQVTPKVASMFEGLRGCTLHNHYGPSETHVVTAYTLSGEPQTWEARPPIGRPIANCEIYLLDSHGAPVPVGVPGEVFIGGECLARGYLNREDVTREKFVAHPFREGAKVYRTGDLARYRADGNIDFLGRIDHQVKLNGYRIELGEIEAVLGQHPAVGECAVVVRGEGQTRKLVAYFVTAEGHATPSTSELRAHLQQRLPDYMLPAAFMTLAKLPLTPSGKVDRRALPAPETSVPEVDAGRAPSSMAEELLADIWRDVLALDRVSVTANFFELGGHSLLATQVISRLHESLGVDLPLARFFAAPTIAQLAPVIEEALVQDIKATAAADLDPLGLSPLASGKA